MRTLLTVRALPIFAAALTLAACGSSGTSAAPAQITLENCGQQVVLSATPARAVTMNQGATESALSVGAQDQLVGTAYLDDEIAPQWAGAYAEIPVLSDKYPSREALLQLKPDLVLASYSSAFGDKQGVGTRESLEELGIATYVSPFACEDKSKRPAVSWDSIAGEITDNATLFGQTEQGREVTDKQSALLAEITAAGAGKGKSILWYDDGDATPSVGGNSGGPQLIMDAVGARNVYADVEGNWVDGSWETVLQADPDFIVVADSSWNTAAEKRAYLENDPALRDLTAVKNNRIIVVPFSTTTPGPRTIEGARLVSEQLAQA